MGNKIKETNNVNNVLCQAEHEIMHGVIEHVDWCKTVLYTLFHPIQNVINRVVTVIRCIIYTVSACSYRTSPRLVCMFLDASLNLALFS